MHNLKSICDSVADLPMFRADTQTGLYAKQLVTATFRELFRFEYPETKWLNGGLLPISSTVNEGATEYSWVEMDHAGRAEIVADCATDIPFADVEGRNNLRSIKTLAVGVKYSRQDVRTARMHGLFEIASEKAAAAREAMVRKLDDLIRTGDGPAGLDGVVNQPGIIVAAAGTGSWQTAAAADIVSDMTTAINTVINDSDGVETPNTVVMDVASYTRVSTLQNSTASDITVLQYLQRAFPMITRWDWEQGMKDVSASSGPSVLVYRNDPSRVRAVIPMAMQAVPPQQMGLSFTLNFETRFGGVMAPRPRSILRLDGV
jgi:hypothetical protein